MHYFLTVMPSVGTRNNRAKAAPAYIELKNLSIPVLCDAVYICLIMLPP